MTDEVSKVSNESLPSFEHMDRNVSTLYHAKVGAAGFDSFTTTTLPVAKDVFSTEPSLYQQTLRALIEAAAETSPDSMDTLWTTDVSQDTFDFQKQLPALQKPSDRVIAGKVFHINHRLLLENLEHDKMIPQFIREGSVAQEDEEFDEDEYDDDHYNVNFASGNVDELAAFLTGIALIGKSHDWNPPDYKRVNNLDFSRKFSLAIADQKQTTDEGVHNILTVYNERKDATVGMFVSKDPIEVQTIRIPTTVLLPEQIAELREEGASLFEKGEFSTRNIYFPVTDKYDAGSLYAQSKHYELAIKYALLTYADSSV